MATSIFSIAGITPPERFDDIPWTSARLEQSDTETGSYTLLEAFDLDPLDSDPADPQSRSFTTELATVDKWYRVVFDDETGDLSEPSAPVQNVSGVEAYVTAAEFGPIINIRNATAEQTSQMERVLLAAAGEINSYIGRSDLSGWELALAAEVNIERAAEHWSQMKSAFGIVGLGGETPMHTATNSWDRHASKLVPLKRQWGLA